MFKAGDRVTFIQKSRPTRWNYYDLKIGKDYIIYETYKDVDFTGIRLNGYSDIQDSRDFQLSSVYYFNKKLNGIIDEV